MPLIRFDLIEGRNDEELKTLLDAAHRAMLAAFKVPERDRYQIVHEHKRSQLIVEDEKSRSTGICARSLSGALPHLTGESFDRQERSPKQRRE